MKTENIKKGYYWVKFYNHDNVRQLMLFNGKNFEGFKSDIFIHDEIESYEPVESTKQELLKEELENGRVKKILYKYLSSEFETGTKCSPTDANNSEYHLPRIDLSVIPELIKEILTTLDNN